MTRTHSVLVVDLAGAVLATIPDALLPSWSPDGTKLVLLVEWTDDPGVEPVCAFSNSARIGVFDLLSGETTPLTTCDCYFNGPEWSPDGAALLYAWDGDIYQYVFSEGKEHAVRKHGEDDSYWAVTWVPDGSRFSTFHQLPTTDTSLGAYEVYQLGSEKSLVSFPEPQGGCGRGTECRAWPVAAGTAVLEAAGRIHTDMERGFIRAEAIAWEELMGIGSFAEAKKRGRLRSEGKRYVVQDGDVLHILFHV